jgi:hypothetical protein
MGHSGQSCGRTPASERLPQESTKKATNTSDPTPSTKVTALAMPTVTKLATLNHEVETVAAGGYAGG